eukprot:2255280-Pyramimonas_sp.AAC.1
MPTVCKDCETACLCKQLLLIPLEVDSAETPEDERAVQAFAPLMEASDALRDMRARGQLLRASLETRPSSGRRGGPRRCG